MLRIKDMSSIIAQFPEQIKEAQDMGGAIRVTSPIDRVLVCGMGGSGIAGFLLKDLLRNEPLQIEVSQNYTIPGWVNDKTLVFICSYSGNTEETMEMFIEAHRKKAKIIILTSGGKLQQQAMGKTFVKLPTRMIPRTTLAYFFLPMFNILKNSELIEENSPDIYAITKALENTVWSEHGEAIAKKLEGKLPIIYTSQRFASVGMRWKQQLNENAKTLAFASVVSENNHNEIEGFQNLAKPVQVIMIQDEKDHKQIRKRMMIVKRMLEEQNIDTTTIRVKGDSHAAKLLSAIHLGDWVSVHLANLYNADAIKTKQIDEIKSHL